MAKERLYTEKEFSAIIKRAGERQSEQSDKETAGLSLQEIQQIAGEVGLEPTLVASVAAELDQKLDKEGHLSWWKMPTKLEVERIVPGNISEEQWPEIILAIEKALGVSGTWAQVGRMLEWTYMSEAAQYKVSFSPGDGQTRVRLFGNFSQLSWISLSSCLIIILMSCLIVASFWGTIIGSISFGVVAAFLVYMLLHAGLTNYIQKKERTFYHLLTHLEHVLTEDPVVSVSSKTANVSQEVQIVLPGEDVAGVEPEPKPVRKKII